jgi:hypothetical protein
VLADATLGVLEPEARKIQDIPAALAQLRFDWTCTIRHPTL